MKELFIQQQVKSLCKQATIKYQMMCEGGGQVKSREVIEEDEYKRKYKEAKMQSECERKIQEATIESLENKVSEVIA